MTRLVRAGWVLGIVWAVLALAAVVLADADPDERTMILTFAGIAGVAAVGATLLLGQGRIRQGGAALLVAGLCAPTFGVAILSFVPIVVGGILAVRKQPAGAP